MTNMYMYIPYVSGRGNFAHFVTAAMVIKIAMDTLTLSCYTGKEFCALPTSAMGWASACVDLV